MAQNDMLKRYLDAGLAFTQMTRTRAEAIVKDLVKAGEIQRDQTQERVEELVERSRKNTEQIVELVRKEITQQTRQIRSELSKLEHRIEQLRGAGVSATGGKPKSSKPSTPTGEAGSSKVRPSAAAKKAVAKKTASPAKKTASPAKKAPAPAKAAAKAVKATPATSTPTGAKTTSASTAAKTAAKKAGGVKKA